MPKEKIPVQPALAEEENAPREPSALQRLLTRIGTAVLLVLALVFAYVFLLMGEPEEDAKNAAPAAENVISMPMRLISRARSSWVMGGFCKARPRRTRSLMMLPLI